MNDINCSDTVNWNDGAGFEPIGPCGLVTGDECINDNYSSTFMGSFNGNNHNISGLHINNSSANFVGLFGVASSGAIISNVNLIDLEIKSNNYVGGLIGIINNGTITNSSVTGNVIGGDNVGGFAGYIIEGGGLIINSILEGNVSGIFSRGLIGGINGACINLSCDSAVSLIRSPASILTDERTWEVYYDDESDNSPVSYAGWRHSSNNQYNYVWASVSVLPDKKAVEQALDNALEYQLCDKQRVYFDYDSEDYQTVYVCKNIWRLAYDAQKISPQDNWNYNNDVVVMWFNDNKLFNMEFSMNNYNSCYTLEDCEKMENWNHQRRQEDLIRFMDSLLNNQGKWTSAYMDYLSESFVKYFLNGCSSEVSDEGYLGSWNCKQEPVICPPHGEQKQTCTRWNQVLNKEEKRETTISCSPGLCSGCYVSKWFGYSGDNKCIPYGFRFEEQGEDMKTNTIYNDGNTHGGDLFLNVTGDNSAYLKFGEGSDYEDYWSWQWVSFEGEVKEGESYYFSWPKESDVSSGYFTVDKIVSSSESSGGVGYLVLTFKVITSLNAYCDIDGQVKQQKVSQYGEWAKCQNNYECFSNVCSNGECVDTAALARELTGFRGFVIRMLCSLSNPFSEEGYAQCLSDNQ